MKSTVVALMCLGLACGSDDDNDASGGAGGTAGASASGGSGGTSLPAEPCPSDIAWGETTPLGSPRDHHVTFVVESEAGPHLYVAGGNNYQLVFSDVLMAPIGQDGQLGAWEATAELPSGRSGMGVVVRPPHVVIMAGRTLQGGLTDISDVVVGTVGADGTVGAWAAAPPLPDARFHLSAALADDVIYVTGGLGFGSTSSDTVWSATLATDGTVSAWQTLGPLTRTRSHHASFVHDGYLYVAGGLDGRPAGVHEPLADVERAAIVSDGGLGAWEPVGTLERPVSTHSASLRGACVLMSGGIDDGTDHSTAVRHAEFVDDGSLGTWSDMPTRLPQPRSHAHQAPIYGDHMYVVGGSVGLQQVTDAVAIGSIASD